MFSYHYKVMREFCVDPASFMEAAIAEQGGRQTAA